MKIVGLISDTHIPARAKAIPEKALDAFKEVSLIVHAGDLIQFSVLDDLERLALVVAVCGNMDRHDVKERLPNMNSVRVYDWKIGVIHDAGAPPEHKEDEKNREAEQLRRAGLWSHSPTYS